ncbi:hypothetical protein LTR17_010271 [Elasticomyces elasticus]|nr:hypothetical protein LTR17_010271 [Elasticomyces elasticus]
MDEPCASVVYRLEDPDEEPTPCNLTDTTRKNGRPPLIWSVCRESRAVALETAGDVQVLQRRPAYAKWGSGIQLDHYWEDRVRDSPHMNWEKWYAAQVISGYGNPFHALAWEASRLSGVGSMMIYLLEGSPYIWPGEEVVPVGDYPDLSKRWNQMQGREPAERHMQRMDLQALRQLTKWLVVMRTVVVHCDLRTGASTGLFGLAGDAPVQVADVADAARTMAFLDLAHKCESKRTVAVQQDFQSPDVKAMTEELQKVLAELGYQDIRATFRPAIMFRLCTQMCDNRGNVYDRHSTIDPWC